MDFKKIFVKNACPTKIGGQAVIDGVMMKSPEKLAVAVRLPDNTIQTKIEKTKKASRLAKVPFVRGAIVFVDSLITGTRTLMYSAEVLGNAEDQEEEFEEDKVTAFLVKRFGEEKTWSIMVYASVIMALAFTIGAFIIFPTAAVNWLGKITENEILLNLVEGILRIIIFVIYILAISKMEDIKKVFRYHGAEHKCIHCYESGLELTPENCMQFYTLHPRCGTSFLVFVMLISLVLFSLLGWPNLLWRITSRLLLLPVIAGISYELLKVAGNSDNVIVRFLSLPGLYLQKLTTAEPTEKQLEVAIAAMKAVICSEGDESIEKAGGENNEEI